METSITKNKGCAPVTFLIVTTPSAIDHPSFLFERLLDAG
jgi:hypothetical protein